MVQLGSAAVSVQLMATAVHHSAFMQVHLQVSSGPRGVSGVSHLLLQAESRLRFLPR